MSEHKKLTDRTASKRARLGAKALDVAEPAWESRINLIRLDIADASACMIGQLDGIYSEWKAESILARAYPELLDKPMTGKEWSKILVDHGFAVTWAAVLSYEDWKADNHTLTVAWKELIEERRQEREKNQ